MKSPEQTLWKAVLLTAVEDALQGVRSVEVSTARAVADARAKLWFTQPTENMANVCNLAGFDPVAVRDAMRKRIAELQPDVMPDRGGVPADLPALTGTGAETAAQDMPEIEFPNHEEAA